MPLILRKSLENCHIGMWHITETLDELEDILNIIPEHNLTLSNFKFDKRKLEWICSRALVKELIPDITQVNIIYDINGKPHLEPVNETRYQISISHSRDHVAVMVCENKPVGIDLETILDRILAVSKRFLNENELQAVDPVHTVEHMHVLWGAKEVMYKLYSIGELDFQKCIFTDKFNYLGKGNFKGYILKDDFAKCYNINYEKIDNLMLVYGQER